MAHKYPADWSRVHGFFAAMGGFFDRRRLLSLEELVLNKEIEYPIATREETSPLLLSWIDSKTRAKAMLRS